MKFDKYATSLEFDKVISDLSACAVTPCGAKRCMRLEISTTKEEIEKNLALTSEAKQILDEMGEATFSVISHISDFANILKTKILTAEDILNSAKTLLVAEKARKKIEDFEKPQLTNITKKIYTNKDLREKIFLTFNDNLKILPTLYPELKALHNARVDTEINLKNKISELLKNQNFTSYLQDTTPTTRAERVVFQVRASFKTKVHGIIHDTSSSGQTFFIEPNELVPLNNKLREIEIGIIKEEERIIKELSEELHTHKEDLILLQDVLSELDFIFAKASYSIKIKGVEPAISNKKIIKAQGARHPLLINYVENIVENDFLIGEDYNSLIITGANTGGKTVILKTIGLFVLMAKAGLHLPALDATIYPFKKVFADISEEQSLAQSLSTFSAHIQNVAGIMGNVDDNSLVLFDELGAGTDPSEGEALAQAILEHLSKLNCITILTTHFGGLKLLEYENKHFKNASVEFDTKTLSPTYKLYIGLAGSSNGLNISKNYNIDEKIINRAKNILSKTQNSNYEMFEKIQKTHSSLKELEETAKIKEEKAKEKNIELEKKITDIKVNKKKSLESFKKKYQSALEAARAEIKETLDELRAEKSEKIARRSYSRLAKLEAEARAQFADDEEKLSNKYEEIDWETIKVGSPVLVKGVDTSATLLSLPDKKGNVEIQLGLLKTTLKTSKLAFTNKKPAKKLQKVSVDFGDTTGLGVNLLRLDLRGERVEEALTNLECHLDLASLKNVESVTIIHGHGLGALKSAVREYLQTSPYVSKFRAGNIETEGGDGVTIAYLN